MKGITFDPFILAGRTRLEEGQECYEASPVTHIGNVVGDNSIRFWLVPIKILGDDHLYYRLHSDKNTIFSAYLDVWKSGRDLYGVWDKTLYKTEEAGLARAKEILSKEFPALDLSPLAV